MDFAADHDEEPQDQAPQMEGPFGFMNHAFASSNGDFDPSFNIPLRTSQYPDPAIRNSRGLYFLNKFAKTRACLEGSPTSRFVGSFGFVTETGELRDGVLPILFRCVWPPGSGSRHVLLHMTSSIDLKDLGRALDLAFKIVDTGGAIASTEIVWVHGPETRPNTVPSFDFEYSLLGHLQNGIVEVRVESIADALRCVCGASIPREAWALKRLRARYDRRMFKSVCLACLEYQKDQKKNDAQEEEASQIQLRALAWDPVWSRA